MNERLEYQSFESAQGIKIYYWEKIPYTPRGVVIICHGYGEHAGFYKEFGDFLGENGFAVYAYDQRAHGNSEAERGHIERFEHFTDDLAEVVSHVKQKKPALPIYIFGHSMGGLIAFTYGILHPETVQGQIFTGPAIGRPWGTDFIPQRFFPFIGHCFKRTKVYHINLGQRGSRNREYCLRYRHDPLKLRYSTVGFFYEFIGRGIPWAQENARDYRLPCLFLHGQADKVIPCRATVNIYGHISALDKELKVYPGLYHELVQEPEREQVWQDIVGWLNRQTGSFEDTGKNALPTFLPRLFNRPQ